MQSFDKTRSKPVSTESTSSSTPTREKPRYKVIEENQFSVPTVSLDCYELYFNPSNVTQAIVRLEKTMQNKSNFGWLLKNYFKYLEKLPRDSQRKLAIALESLKPKMG
jgi:hypothetical protein